MRLTKDTSVVVILPILYAFPELEAELVWEDQLNIFFDILTGVM